MVGLGHSKALGFLLLANLFGANFVDSTKVRSQSLAEELASDVKGITWDGQGKYARRGLLEEPAVNATVEGRLVLDPAKAHIPQPEILLGDEAPSDATSYHSNEEVLKLKSELVAESGHVLILQRSLEAVSSELELEKKHTSEIEASVNSLNSQLADSDQKNSIANDESAEKSKKIVELEGKVNDGIAIAQGLSSEKERCYSDKTTLTESLQRMRGELESMTTNHRQSTSQAETLTRDLEAMRAELKESKEQRFKMVRELDQQRTSLEATQKKLDTALAELDSTSSKLAESEESLTHVSEQYQVLQNEYEIIREKAENPDLVEAISKSSSAGLNQLYQSNPAIEAAVNKTVDMLLPSLVEKRVQGAVLLNETHIKIKNRVMKYIQPKYVPWVSGFLVYGLVFIPLFLTFWTLATVHAVFKLRPLLKFAHVYLAILCALTAIAACFMKADPLTYLQQQDAGTYVFTQGLVGVVLVTYASMLVCAFLTPRTAGEGVLRLLQLVAVAGLECLYYELVWSRAMLDKPPTLLFSNPHHIWLPYALGALVFALILLLEKNKHRMRGREMNRIKERSLRAAEQEDDSIRISVNVEPEARDLEKAE